MPENKDFAQDIVKTNESQFRQAFRRCIRSAQIDFTATGKSNYNIRYNIDQLPWAVRTFRPWLNRTEIAARAHEHFQLKKMLKLTRYVCLTNILYTNSYIPISFVYRKPTI